MLSEPELFYVIIRFITEKIHIPADSKIFSFLLANTDFFMGVLNAVLGKRIISYKNK